MVDINDYTYWMRGDNATVMEEAVTREMYCRIGCVLHIVQMIEYNLANIMSIELIEKRKHQFFGLNELEDTKKKIRERFVKLSSKDFTFGRLVREARKCAYLKSIDFHELEMIVDYRNYLAHICFKEKLMNGTLNTIEEKDKFAKELADYESRIAEMNDQLVDIFKERNRQIVTIRVKPKKG